MYQGEQNKKTAPKESQWITNFKDAFSGKLLLKTIKKWAILFIILVTVIMIAVFNANRIEQKELRNKELQKQYDSIVIELKERNEIIYTEDKEKLRTMAQERGFEDIPVGEYYKIDIKE